MAHALLEPRSHSQTEPIFHVMTFAHRNSADSGKQIVSGQRAGLVQTTAALRLLRRDMLLGVGALSASGVLLTLGCEKEQTAYAQQGPLVALLLATLQEERYQKDKRFFEAKARELGLRPFTLSADNDSARQLSQVEDALARGAEILVIQTTDRSAASGYVARAHAAGAKVVAYDRTIDEADAWVVHDNFQVGQLQAEAALKKTGGRGNYILLNGQSGHSVAKAISHGYHETLAPYVKSGRVTIVLDQSHDAWSPEQALKTVEDALTKTHGQVDAILANNSGLARGAVQAVNAKGLGDRGIFIAGADADAANVNYVCQGKQSVEVYKDIQALAETAAQVTADLSAGKALATSDYRSGVPVVGLPVRLVTMRSVQSVLIESGFHDRKQLTSCASP